MITKTFLASFTIQKEWDNDPIKMIDVIKTMGYDGMELSVDKDDSTIDAIAEKMKEAGLIAVCTHINFDLLNNEFNKYISRIKKLGIKNLCIPWLDRNRLPGGEDYQQTKKQIKTLSGKCFDNGIILSYHNHNFEFEKIGGVCKLDILFQDIPELKSQLDVCWCAVGGQDPAEFIRHYGHRMPTIHLKDFTALEDYVGEKLFNLLRNSNKDEADKLRGDSGFDFRPVGYGKVNFKSVFQAIKETGINWMGVEQDVSTERPPLKAAKMSISYIKENY